VWVSINVRAKACASIQVAKSHLFDACKTALGPLSRGDAFEKAVNGKSAGSNLVTKKLQLLAATLLDEHKRNPEGSIICFVEMRVTSTALAQLLMRSRPHARLAPSYLIGGASVSVLRQSLKEQQRVLANFQGGQSKLLIATEVAEEGLDIQSCQTVISFDPPKRPKGFIQRRGRARAHGGKMYVFIAESDDNAKATMQQFVDTEDNMNKAALDACDPDDDTVGMAGLELGAGSAEQLRVDATGACVTLSSAVTLLHHYCQVMAPNDNFYVDTPLFWREGAGEPFKVYLGVWAPIRFAQGRPYASTREAKASASLALLRALHEAQSLDDHLSPFNPLSKRSSTVDPEALLTDSQWVTHRLRGRDVGVYGREDRGASSIDCATISIPQALRVSGPASMASVSLHALQVIPDDEVQRLPLFDSEGSLNLDVAVVRHAYESIESKSLWAPQPLPPDASSIKLWYRGRYGLTVNLKHVGQRVIAEQELFAARLHHRKLFAQCGQRAEPSSAADTAGDGKCRPFRGRCCYIVAEGGTLEPPEQHSKRARHFLDHGGGRGRGSFSLVLVRATHSGQHYIVPQGSHAESALTSRSNVPGKEPPTTFIELYKAAHSIDIQRPDDRLLPAFVTKAKPTPQAMDRQIRRDTAAPSAPTPELASAGRSRVVHMAPELMEPVLDKEGLTQWHASRLLPYLLWSLEQLLVAHELRNELVDTAVASSSPARTVSKSEAEAMVPGVNDIVMAITSASCARSFSLERLETLGDAFLKLEVSTQLCESHRTLSEGDLTHMRSRIVSNRALALRCASLGIAKYLRVQPFMENGLCTWQPPEPGAGSNADSAREHLRPMRLKVLGDMLEALIGAFVRHGGQEGGREAVQLLGVLPDGGRAGQASASAELPRPRAGGEATTSEPFPLPPFVESSLRLGVQDTTRREAVSALCDFPFRDDALVREAMTHCSRQFEPSYQRLEFLGDAVLDYIVTDLLYNRQPELSPGQMTQRRQELVRNSALARRCVQLGLHSWIRHLSSPLTAGIATTVRKVDQLGQRCAGEGPKEPDAGATLAGRSVGAHASGGEAARIPGTVAVASSTTGTVPDLSLCKVCADVVESLIGAMYIEARTREDPSAGSHPHRAIGSNGGSASTSTPARSGRQDAALAMVTRSVLGRVLDKADLQKSAA